MAQWDSCLQPSTDNTPQPSYTWRVNIESLLRSAGPLIERALAEDIGTGDRTSEAIVAPDMAVTCTIVTRAAGVIAGLPIAEAVFHHLDSGIAFLPRVQDGEPVEAGQPVVQLQGRARSILTAERTALNFLGRLSGIATLTSQFADAVANHRAVILDTRKTTPGWRELEKYAVRCGGGRNHRMGLYDMVLVKDNHIAAAGALREAVRRAREAGSDLPVEVEVRSLEELEQALELHVYRVLLDNMDIASLQRAVVLTGGNAVLEASGGVGLAQAEAVAATGVDAISVGALTHSAPALDLSLEMVIA